MLRNTMESGDGLELGVNRIVGHRREGEGNKSVCAFDLEESFDVQWVCTQIADGKNGVLSAFDISMPRKIH